MGRARAGRGTALVLVVLLSGQVGCERSDRIGEPEGLEAPAAIDFAAWDPSFHRAREVSLNGDWSFDWDPEDQGESLGWHLPETRERLRQRIRVPYPWGSALSGQGSRPPEEGSLRGGTEAVRRNYRGKAWYARSVDVPEDWPRDGTTIARFGAVDWRSRVFVNGMPAGSHEGGFDPFEIDVTRWARPGTTFHLVVEVEDRCDEDPSSLTGKQGGIWYSCVGGIWQDVTLLWRPDTWLSRIVQHPDTVPGTSQIRASLSGEPGPVAFRMAWRCTDSCPLPCEGRFESSVTLATDSDEPASAEVSFSLALPPENEWSPDSPCLATWRIEIATARGTDRVEGYLGSRRIRRGAVTASGERTRPPAADVILLNDRPLYVRAALDQCWDPDGILTASSLERRRDDFRFLKQAGFNVVRLHLKPEEPRVLALADTMGLGVIADMPSPPSNAGPLPDALWVPAWDRLWRAMLDRDRNHPSILWWTLFNEAWGLLDPPFWDQPEGLEFVRERFRRARSQDPTRLVEDNSPTLADGHVESDLASWHFYSPSIPLWKDLTDLLEDSLTFGGEGLRRGGGTWTGQPFVNTEFGGLGADDTRGDHGWPIHGILNVLRGNASLSGYVFTEAYDVEWEHNGLRTFDRNPKDLGLDELGLSLADLFGESYLVLGDEPGLSGTPGSPFSIPLAYSTLRESVIDRVMIRIRSRDDDRTIRSWEVPGERCGPGVTALSTVTGTFPEEPGIHVLEAIAWSGPEAVARNALYLVSDPGHTASGPGRLSLEPWHARVEGEGACTEGACWCEGACAIRFRILDGMAPSPGSRLILMGEFSAHDPRTPQTGASSTTPSRIEVLRSGRVVATEEIPPARCDHRGVLSWLYAQTSLRGAYGDLRTFDLGTDPPEPGEDLVLRVPDGGLLVFFRSGGRHLVPLQLVWTP